MGESAPEFAQRADLILFVAEGLIGDSIPWERSISPERVARKLRASGIKVSLHALGKRDPIELIDRIAQIDEAAGSVGAKVLNDLELDWIIRDRSEPVAGLRELVLHLESSKKPVSFVSALASPVARQAVQSRLGVAAPIPVYGRSQVDRLPSVYSSVVQSAMEVTSAKSCCLIVHKSVEKLIDATAIPCSVLVVGDGPGRNEEQLSLDIIDLANQCELTKGERSDIEKRIARRDRVRELWSVNPKSNEQMAEYIDLAGGVRLVGNTEMYGYSDPKKGSANVALIRKIRESAAEHQHLLEVISIDATLLEVELRNWLIIHKDEFFAPEVRLTFGQLVDMAERKNFTPSLVARLRAFNKLRNDAIHHLSRGISTYHEMTDTYMDDCSLTFDVEDFVLESAPVIGRSPERYW